MVRGNLGYLVSYSLGLVLCVCSISNWLHGRSQDRRATVGPVPNGFSDHTFQQKLIDYRKRIREGAPFALAEANMSVHLATRHVGLREITFGENSVQWLAGFVYRPFRQTQNTKLLIEGKLGNCSDRCQILKTIAEEAGCQCRFVGLGGHVVLEVEQAGRWVAADPDYNVVYAQSVDELAIPQNEPHLRRRIEPWYPPEVVDRYVEIFQTTSNNVHLPVGQYLSPRLAVAESVFGVLNSVLTAVLLGCGVPLFWKSIAERIE